MGICILNRLFVLPTLETVTLLSELFRGGPFSIDWSSIGLEVGSSERTITPLADSVTYSCLPGSMNTWYDSAVGRAFLLLPLYPSPKLIARNKAVGDAWGRAFIPFLPLVDSPTNRRNRKAWLNSVATGLVDRLPVLTFDSELVITDYTTVPAQQDFYEDVNARGLYDDQLFVQTLGTDYEV